MLFILSFPIIQIICFAFGIAKQPIGLKLGIVNNEIHDFRVCSEYLESTNFTFSTNSCYFENLSCYFLNEIQDSTAAKVYYNSFDEAFRDAKATSTYGFISISSNFTKGMIERKSDWQPLNKLSPDADIIQVHLDHTQLVIQSFLQYKLSKAFERLNKKVLRHCELNENLEDSPLNMNDGLLYGTFEDDYTVTMMPGIFAQLSGLLIEF